ncbi:MAG: UDP-N-acetylmuramate dehydrogenase [Cyanobacteriota bacterium]|nr:UDP-N-acetylmuramate dehydrogenase [Cyanobacteriota bacterium]
MSASPKSLRERVLLRDFTTWKVGGPADWFAEPTDRSDLLRLAAWALGRGLSLRCIGAGSNLLIADDGLRGVTVCLRRLQGSHLDPTEGMVEAEAGEPIPSLARKAARAGLSGLEWAVGIPGTVGGAVVMNAGAQGGCTAERLQAVLVADPADPDHPFWLRAADLAFAYRSSRLQSEPLIVVAARFCLDPGHDPAVVTARTSANLNSRTTSQPYQLPSCGSVFRNPEPLKAGRLIEAMGLKGHRIGGAEVSRLHANFIVNTGAASATDIQALIDEVQRRVLAEYGVTLHPEVKRLGFP